MMPVRRLAVGTLLVAAASVADCAHVDRLSKDPSRPPHDTAQTRLAAIRRAHVWAATDVASMDLMTGPSGPGAFPPNTTVTCDYNIPVLDGGQIDFGSVNVRTTIGPTGMPTLLGQVPGAAACGTGDGWYFDHPVPPGNPPPTTITLCPQSCSAVQNTMGSQLDVLLGCKTTPRVN